MNTLNKIETGKKSPKYLYQVVNENGEILSERKSNREYVACTVYGEFFFGRIDLIGKGEHGSFEKMLAEKEPGFKFEIAYLSKK